MATENGFVQPAIPKFDGHYDHWSMLMENFLRSKEYWHLVENGITSATGGKDLTEAEKKAIDDQKLKDLKAKNYLFQAIDRSILETILKKDTAKDIWDSLKQKYQGTTRVKRAQRQALRKEFEVLHMKTGESVNDYFGRTLTIANKLKMTGEQMDDVHIIEKILRSMTSNYDYVVCSIEESKDLDLMSIDELQSSILVHEQRMGRHVEDEQALQVSQGIQQDGRSGGRGFFRGSGSGRGRGRGRGQGRGGRFGYDKSTIECYNCHDLGHFQWECPKDATAHYTEAKEEMLLMALMEIRSEHTWFLDSGCSNHMCGSKELFDDEFDSSFRESVKLGNNSRLMVQGKGTVRLEVDGVVLVITGVFFVPALVNSLVSIGQLQEKGIGILIQNNTCRAFHPQRGVIFETKMTSNRMFPLVAHCTPKKQQCFSSITTDQSDLWHYRYGHLSWNSLKVLQQKTMVKGLPRLTLSQKVCEDCLVGKQHRSPFPSHSTWRASTILQLVHTDLCGPVKPSSNTKKRYVITFTDDFSRKTWSYFLTEKSEAFATFKLYKARVEKETGTYIRALRSDRGGEFTSSEFQGFCSENGIQRQLTSAYSPQQNGVAERKNRTILNMARSMLSAKKIPKTFWPEAVNWAVYVLNRSPTLALKSKTPEEAWTGIKPSVNHFRVFGCIGHVHVPDEKRVKLDSKSFKCVLFGVSDESKAYRLFDPTTNKIIVSRDVVFEEDQQWSWDDSHKQAILVDLEWEYDDEPGTEDERKEPAEVEKSPEKTPDRSEGDHSGLEISPGVSEQGDSSIDNSLTHSRRETQPQTEQYEGRIRKQPVWMKDYDMGDGLSDEETAAMIQLAMVSNQDPDWILEHWVPDQDPTTYDEAVKSKEWKRAMDQEIQAIEKNKTWELTSLPSGGKSIGVKWVFKTKLNENGEVDKYKARLVAKGYAQEYGIDYAEVFAPVARLETIRLIISLAAQQTWKIYQLDVKSAFLHGEINEEVFVDQPPGYEQKGHEHKVYRLKKALYGLKQAPRAWYSRIEAYFIKEGFTKCPYEHTLFIKYAAAGNILIVCLYVDDLIYTGNNEKMFEVFKKSMMAEFDMTDLGRMRYFLGIEVLQRTDGIFIGQRKYAQEMLERFNMSQCNPVQNPIVPGFKLTKDEEGVEVDGTIYRQMVGSLMYLTTTRPDLMFIVSLISRYMKRPTKCHWAAARRVLRYVKGTINCGVFYKKGGNDMLIGYTDSDYAGDLDDRKSTSGSVFLMSSGAVSWSSTKQPIVTLSTTEAEFIAAASSSCQAVWLRRILGNLNQVQGSPTLVYCDNISAIKLSKNPVMHGRSKHIDVRFHFLRDLVKNGVVELIQCSTQDQVADILTKPLKLDAFLKIRGLLGVCECPGVN